MSRFETGFDTIIQGGTVVFPDTIQRCDIGIRQGQIVYIGAIDSATLAQATQMIDATGLHIMAGMIDAHVHLNEPGLGDWEGFVTGSSALAAGGCTTFLDMPLNGIPPTVTVAALEQKVQAAHGTTYIDYACWGGLVPGKLEHLEPLAQAGVCGFKAFMSAPGDPDEEAFRNVDDETLLEGMRRIARTGHVLALHAEYEPLVAQLTAACLAEQRTSAADYSASRPIAAEVAAVRQALDYAQQTGCRLHFVHISSAEAVQLIQQARADGMDVTLETCPHYLALTDHDLEQIGAAAKCAPPLRNQQQQEQLWQCVASGEIDMITSDHSPCPTVLKQQAQHMFDAWGGISGAQHSLELMLEEGHLRRGLPLPLLTRLLSLEPARRFGLLSRKGELRIGADADLVIVNLHAGYRIEAEQLYYRHKHSPYIGRTLGCRVEQTISRGQVVYTRQQGMIGEPQGQQIRVTIGQEAGTVT
ncbi:allantoinase [Paenibacillus campi]|uniref:allantoinase n=1 Tax=Paenibacillus campi TaxID=3106031 RepID=UPI002B002D82|nr:allantoinase [Paenibacillus sp. SGZ-1009]